MLQQIITYLILAGTVAYTARQVYLFFKPSKQSKSGCSSGCSNCGLKSEILAKLQENNKL